jgi:hypothetical protein
MRCSACALLLLLLASPALAAPVRCQTHHEPPLNRLMTLCSDDTRAVSTWSPTLRQWTTTVTPPPGQTCEWRLNPKIHAGVLNARNDWRI